MKLLFYLLFLFSCSYNDKYISIKDFDIEIIDSNLSRIQQKILLEQLINQSLINYNANSEFLIKLNIKSRTKKSLVSSKNISTIVSNVEWIVRYILVNKNTNKIFDEQKFIIVEDVYDSDYLFSNFQRIEYNYDNLVKKISNFIERKIKIDF